MCLNYTHLSLCTLLLTAACGKSWLSADKTGPTPHAQTAQSSDVANNQQGQLALSLPVLQGIAVGDSQLKLIISAPGRIDDVLTVPYKPETTISSRPLAPARYKLTVVVSALGTELYIGQTDVIITAGQTAQASVQLKPVGAGKGQVDVKVLAPEPPVPPSPPAPTTACEIYDAMGHNPMTLLCQLGTFTCQWTAPGGKVYTSAPKTCASIHAQLDLLQTMCAAKQTVTEADFHANVTCANAVPTTK